MRSEAPWRAEPSSSFARTSGTVEAEERNPAHPEGEDHYSALMYRFLCGQANSCHAPPQQMLGPYDVSVDWVGLARLHTSP